MVCHALKKFADFEENKYSFYIPIIIDFVTSGKTTK